MKYHHAILANYSLFAKEVFHRLSSEKISSGQPKVLEYLLEHGESVQKEIAKACYIEPASVTSVLAKMERDGYIVRKMREDNRRFLHIELTDLGREKALLVQQVFRECEERALEVLDGQEREMLIRMLDKVNRNMEKERGGGI